MNAAVEPFGDGKPRESTQKRKKKEQLSQTVSTLFLLFLAFSVARKVGSRPKRFYYRLCNLKTMPLFFLNLPLQAIHLVEKKLQMAIRGEYRTRLARSRRNVNGDGAEGGGTFFPFHGRLLGLISCHVAKLPLLS